MIQRPSIKDFPEYYKRYVDLVSGDSVKEVIHNHSAFINEKLTVIPSEKGDYTYAENKWTVKELVQHLIDAERIFIYRALRFSRKDKTALAGFDEDFYASNCNANSRNLYDLQKEFVTLRSCSDLFFLSLNEEQLMQSGNANNQNITVNALVYICFGHSLHHINILNERYL